MNIEFYDIRDSNIPSIVVIYAKYKEKIVMCMHKERETWEIPGGHIEENELPENAAKRELIEETGAIDFTITPDFKYSFEVDGKKVFCIMYRSTINEIGELPSFEMKKVEFFDELPNNLTYPEIYKKILRG